MASERGKEISRRRSHEIGGERSTPETSLSEALYEHEALQVDARSLELRLTAPGSFFRLHQAEIVTRTRVPQIGYGYRRSGIDIAVTSLDNYGLPVGLSIQMPDTESLQNVYIWDGDRVLPLMDAGSIVR